MFATGTENRPETTSVTTNKKIVVMRDDVKQWINNAFDELTNEYSVRDNYDVVSRVISVNRATVIKEIEKCAAEVTEIGVFDFFHGFHGVLDKVIVDYAHIPQAQQVARREQVVFRDILTRIRLIFEGNEPALTTNDSTQSPEMTETETEKFYDDAYTALLELSKQFPGTQHSNIRRIFDRLSGQAPRLVWGKLIAGVPLWNASTKPSAGGVAALHRGSSNVTEPIRYLLHTFPDAQRVLDIYPFRMTKEWVLIPLACAIGFLEREEEEKKTQGHDAITLVVSALTKDAYASKGRELTESANLRTPDALFSFLERSPADFAELVRPLNAVITALPPRSLQEAYMRMSCVFCSLHEIVGGGHPTIAYDDDKNGVLAELVKKAGRHEWERTHPVTTATTIQTTPPAEKNETGKPAVLPHARFKELLNKPFAGTGIKFSAAAQAEGTKADVHPKLVVADKIRDAATQNLMLDIPKEGIDHWIYIDNFKTALVHILNAMEQGLSGLAPNYMREVRAAWMEAVDLIENEALDNYGLAEDMDRWKGVDIAFKGAVQDIWDTFNHQFDVNPDTKETFVKFLKTDPGREYKQEYDSFFMKDQSSLFVALPVILTRERFAEFDAGLRAIGERFEQLLASHAEAHVGSAAVKDAAESYYKVLDEAKREVEKIFFCPAVPEFFTAEQMRDVSLAGFDQMTAIETNNEAYAKFLIEVKRMLIGLEWAELAPDNTKRFLSEGLRVTAADGKQWDLFIGVLRPDHPQMDKPGNYMMTSHPRHADGSVNAAGMMVKPLPISRAWAAVHLVDLMVNLLARMQGKDALEGRIMGNGSMLDAGNIFSNNRLMPRLTAMMQDKPAGTVLTGRE